MVRHTPFWQEFGTIRTTARQWANREPGHVYHAEFENGRTARILVSEKVDRLTSADWWIVAFPSTIEDQEAVALDTLLGAKSWVRFQKTDGQLRVLRQAPLNGAMRFPLAEGGAIPLATLCDARAALDHWGPGASLHAASPGPIAEGAEDEEDAAPERFALRPLVRRTWQIVVPAPQFRPAAGERAPTAMFTVPQSVAPGRVSMLPEPAQVVAEGTSLPLQWRPDRKLRGRRVMSALVEPTAVAEVYTEVQYWTDIEGKREKEGRDS